MDIKDLANFVFMSKYSRMHPLTGVPETWEQAVQRVADMHYAKTGMHLPRRVLQLWRNKVITGSQRSLQFGGDPILKSNPRLMNCTVSYADRVSFFGEAMWLLLSGCGVGFSVQRHHIAKLPPIKKPQGEYKHTIPDTIEGWASSATALITAYCEGTPAPIFDYSQIRAKGSPISSGGVHPGTEQLKKTLDHCRALLENNEGEWRSIVAFDIVMHLADAVVSGGVRRSATICTFDIDDQDMITAKTGNWFIDNPQRGRANISAVITPESTQETFYELFASTKEFGEPGFIFVKSKEFLFNPCCEIAMCPTLIKDEQGRILEEYTLEMLNDQDSFKAKGYTYESGWQACVAYDTKLITRDGIVTIGEAAEAQAEVEIWNGERWSAVKPTKTGENRKMYRVTFSDGSYLDVTDNHKFLIASQSHMATAGQFKEMTTLECIDKMEKTGDRTQLRVPRANIELDEDEGFFEIEAYNYGFILGDGYVVACSKSKGGYKKPLAIIGDVYIDTPFPFYNASVGEPFQPPISKATKTPRLQRYVRFNSADREFAFRLKYAEGLPTELFSWDRDSIKAFFAGWIDTDGTKTVGGFRIYGREDKLRDAQLLLTKIGVNSSLNLMQKAGAETNVGVRNQDIYYIQVAEPKDLWATKFEMPESKAPVAKGKWQIIRDISLLDGLHDSYCFEEQELHQGVFGNVLTKQCNLSTINCSLIKTPAEFLEAVRAATILGTYQASYDNWSYLGETSTQILKREALLGVSMTGIMSSPMFYDNPDLLEEAASIARVINADYARKLGIRPASRITCVKPEGTASIVLGTSAGIHPYHAKKYLRRVQGDLVEDIFQKVSPAALESNVWSQSESACVAVFACEAPPGAMVRSQLDALKHLEICKMVNTSWVRKGNALPNRLEGAEHNVSVTVTVKPDEWDAVREYIWENREFFSGISLLGASGDYDYAQPPYQEIYEDSEEQQHQLALALYERVKDIPLDLSEAKVDFNPNGESACGGGSCDLTFVMGEAIKQDITKG